MSSDAPASVKAWRIASFMVVVVIVAPVMLSTLTVWCSTTFLAMVSCARWPMYLDSWVSVTRTSTMASSDTSTSTV